MAIKHSSEICQNLMSSKYIFELVPLFINMLLTCVAFCDKLTEKTKFVNFLFFASNFCKNALTMSAKI